MLYHLSYLGTTTWQAHSLIIGNAHVSKYATLFSTCAQLWHIVGNLLIVLYNNCMSNHLRKRICLSSYNAFILVRVIPITFTVMTSRAQTLLVLTFHPILHIADLRDTGQNMELRGIN